jgi:hypothetical protein
MTESSEQSFPITENSVHDLVGIDLPTQQPPPSGDLVSGITGITSTEITLDATTDRTPFLVTNWLVGEGER